MILFVYILNASLLLLHEIESAYMKEWEILKIPGKITTFLLLHIPIILLLFWGAIEIVKQTITGQVLAIVTGVGGTIPFLVHKVAVKKPGYFESPISNAIIFLNLATSIVLILVNLL